MAATSMFPKLGYVPTDYVVPNHRPFVEHHHEVEPHHHKAFVDPHRRTLPHEAHCSFCTHLANRLEAKIASFERARRHVPVGLRRDAEAARRDSTTHHTRDDNRNLLCHRLKNQTCNSCGMKGHTQSRCAPCGYCGIIGHIVNECPKALADERARGETIVLKGVSAHMRDAFAAFLDSYGVGIEMERPNTWVADCSKVVFETVECDDEGVWDVIEVRDCGEPKPEEHTIA